MSNCKLNFSVTVGVITQWRPIQLIHESFFNGEDIVEVEYNGHDVII